MGMMWDPWGRGLAYVAQTTKYEKSQKARGARGQRSGPWKVMGGARPDQQDR